MTALSILGSTGSVGTQALDVIRTSRGEHRVAALGAATSVDALAAQAQEFGPEVVALADDTRAAELEPLLPSGTTLLAGANAMAEAAMVGDTVINGVMGFAGLPVTLATLHSGRRLALANKESLIAAGPVVQAARRTPGAEIIPVDSEHCAVHMCLRSNESPLDADPEDPTAHRLDQVSRIVVTASGGPFRGRAASELAAVTVEDALNHPTWSMGPKITVDSSTLMNKGLEVIEANELFGVGYDRIDVVVHPQSVIHSMVEYTDGATIAQLSLPDMKLCIAYAVAYPDRHPVAFGRIDWAALSRLDFEPPDRTAFPCLDLAYAAGRAGETAPAALSAGNEIAVEAFLAGAIPWMGIAEVNKAVLDAYDGTKADSLEAVLDADQRARRQAGAHVQKIQETQKSTNR